MTLELETILSRIPGKSALVVGDICLDRWCTYDPDAAEPSRETGIPRIGVTHSELTPGAGGTVANNLAALGAGTVSVMGVIGDDGNGYELRKALAARGIHHEHCMTHPGICTFTYTKLLNRTNGEEDLPRVDYINTMPLPRDAEAKLVERLKEVVSGFDVVLVSDQAETSAGGVVTPGVRDALAGLAKHFDDKVFWVDSRLRPEHFRNVIIKPNEDECNAACARIGAEGDFDALRRHTGAPVLLVTHGSRGVRVMREGREDWVPTLAVAQPVDICGAGDSFSAGAALAMAITGDPVAAGMFGNLVASITIMKKGTGTASPDELRKAAARHAG